jgi:hypothetical protein
MPAPASRRNVENVPLVDEPSVAGVKATTSSLSEVSPTSLPSRTTVPLATWAAEATARDMTSATDRALMGTHGDRR